MRTVQAGWQPAPVGAIGHHRDVQVAPVNVLDQCGGQGLDQRQCHVGAVLLEGVEGRGDDPGDSGRKGTDGDVAKGTLPDSIELAAQLIVMGQDRICMLQQTLPVRRRPHASRPTLKQRYAVLALEAEYGPRSSSGTPYSASKAAM